MKSILLITCVLAAFSTVSARVAVHDPPAEKAALQLENYKSRAHYTPEASTPYVVTMSPLSAEFVAVTCFDLSAPVLASIPFVRVSVPQVPRNVSTAAIGRTIRRCGRCDISLSNDSAYRPVHVDPGLSLIFV